MPTYVYKNCTGDETFERNVPISERDNQKCPDCGIYFRRTVAFTGLTWAPTAGGMR